MNDRHDRTVAHWQDVAAWFREFGARAWASDEPYWGIWSLPDADYRLLPETLEGLDCLEIGCGAGYVSAWMTRRGGRVTGIDPTPNQLASAKAFSAEHGLDIRWVQGFGEDLPFPDASFDFAISEYGAALWADPERWVPEAARILRPGGQLVFYTNAAFSTTHLADGEDAMLETELKRPYFDLYGVDWGVDDGPVEFHVPHGRWIEILTGAGFVIERLVEIQAPADAESPFDWADAAWASRWPMEEAWVVRRSS